MPLDALSVVVGALAGAVAVLVVPRAVGRRSHEVAQTASQRALACPVCDGTFGTREAGRDHLSEVHKAPGGRAELNALLEEVDV